MQRGASTRSAPSRGRRPHRVGASLAAGWLAALATLGACTTETPRTNTAYCEAVQKHLELLTTPALAAPTDITTALDAFEAVAASAPAAVEPEWQEVLDVMRAASSVDRSDTVAMDGFVDVALAARSSITRVQQFTQQTCSIDIGNPPTPTNPALVTVVDTAPTNGSGG